MGDYGIGVDLGGTNLRAAAIDSEGSILKKISGTTELAAGRVAVVTDMVAAIRKYDPTYFRGESLCGR